MTEPLFVSQADFARRRGVSRKAVTSWKTKGLLVLDDTGKVNVEATEWNLDQRPAKYRGGVTHRPVRQVGNKATGNKPQAPVAPVQPKAPEPPSDAEDGDGLSADIDPDSPNLTMAEAARRKENFLGLQRKIDFQTKQSALVDRPAAQRAFFEVAKDLRDAWLAWPARVAVLMASDLGVDARTLTMVLSTYVQQHLSELGEPSVDIGR